MYVNRYLCIECQISLWRRANALNVSFLATRLIKPNAIFYSNDGLISNSQYEHVAETVPDRLRLMKLILLTSLQSFHF